MLYHFGYGAGVNAKFKLSEKFDLSTELGYLQKGADLDNSEYSLPRTKWSLHYVGLTSLFLYKLPKNFAVGIGPQLSYMLSANQRSSYSKAGSQDFVTENGDITSCFNKMDYSLVAAISYTIKNNFSLSARYTYGLADINNNVPFIDDLTSMDSDNIPTEYNRSFSFGVTYYFGKTVN